ncbi:single-stranded DNA-binding protein [Candidatus Bathyarchaeota archaeon]|nr:single-stranded DNA-binding protein [Candidatus Bathyarchaeota archaeon]
MTRVRDLTTYSRRVNLIAKVMELGDIREVSSSSDGQLHRVAEALVGDETGTVLLTLWDENIDRFGVGDVVAVDNGYAGTFRGSLRLNVGKYGTIDKTVAAIEAVNVENNLSDREYRRQYPQRRRRY